MTSTESEYFRYSEVLRGQNTPLAFVDLERFDKNAREILRRAKGMPIRVASKSIRSIALIKRLLQMPGYQGVLGYSGWEAIHLSRSGIKDVVVAYPVIQEKEIQAVAEENKKGSSIVLMVDRIEHLENIAKAVRLLSLKMQIAIDLDVSSRWPMLHFGVRRSSIFNEKTLGLFLQELKKHPELELVGMMGYEAQIAGVQDSGPLMRFLKKLAIPSITKSRQALVAQVKAGGHTLRFVNGGGTGSIESTRLDSSVTELAVGSGFYSPTLFEGYDQFHHDASAFYALSVTRKPAEDIATCFSGGYIASGSVGKVKEPKPVLPAGLSLLIHEGAGEVQTPVQGLSARNLKIGDLVFFRHAKAGELCERFNQLHLISGDRILDSVPTYRGEGCNFG